jgi:hypothetical protein
MMARTRFYPAVENLLFSESEKRLSARAAAGTTGSSRKTAAPEKPPAEGIRRLGKRHQEWIQMARREESQRLKAYLSHPLAKNAVTRKHPRWRGCLPDDGRSTHLLDPARQYKGCKAEKGRGSNRRAIAIAAPRSAQQHEGKDASRPSYDDSRTARRGQEDACGLFRNFERGRMGTGARGAPVPEVGL